MNAEIIAIEHGVPGTCQTNEQVAQLIGRSADWIETQAGVGQRYVSERGDDPAELIARIAKPILEKHGPPDLVIHAGTVPRQLLPDTSVFGMRELGLSGSPGFSVNSACLSFLVAMRIADSLIQGGDYRRILICTAEFTAQARNFEQAESAAIIGDGAAAMLLSATEKKVGMLQFQMQTWPQAAELAEFRGAGSMRPPDDPRTVPDDYRFFMDGPRLLRFMAPRLRRFVREFLDRCGLEISQIDLVVPHQTSAAGMKLLQHLGFRADKTINILKEYGNCAAASIPMALSIALQEGRICPGKRILVLGTASGVSIGAALIQW